jgi:serine/threonine protein kinase
MTPERYQQISDLYHAAQEVEPERRSDFLVQACNGDEELRSEVEKLLTGNEEARNFLSTPAFAVAADVLAGKEAQSFIGKRLGRFEILSLLGAGGMGEVYLAKDAQLGRRVALKLLPQEFTSQADRLRRFEREARAASALNHPNIITIHDIGEAEGIHFIATEYIEGEMLRRRIARGRMPLAEAVDVALQVANALDIAHSAGIIHRDIKPENIMRRPDGYVKVLDFGLAKLTEPKPAPPPVTSQIDTPMMSSETSAGMILGTVNYMSPEQARGLKVDRRCDLWSLGVTLYEMVVGKSPFTGQTATDILVSIVDREPQPLTQILPDVPVKLERIVMKALAKDCDRRYQSAKDLAIDLKHLKREVEGSPAVVPPRHQEIAQLTLQTAMYATEALQEAKTAPMPKPAVRPVRLAIAALLIIVVGLGGWWIFRPQSSVTIPPPATTSTPARQASYWFTINGAVTASENQTFNGKDSFSFNLSSPQDGYLYMFNEDSQSGKESRYSLLYPTKSSERIIGNQVFKTENYYFSETDKAGTENLILVWAAQSVPELDALTKWYNRDDLGVIKDPAQVDSLKKFIEQHWQSTDKPDFDEASKQTTIRGSRDILIRKITLTHK